MMKIQTIPRKIKEIFKPLLHSNHERPQLLQFDRISLGEKSRIHLRIEPDGNGTLIVNANRILHLNPTATYMARLILSNRDDRKAINSIIRRYQVDERRAEEDYAKIKDVLLELTRPESLCPIHELDLPTIQPFSSQPSAPYRMDLAITYQCNNDCAHCYNSRERDFPQLSTGDWQVILDKLWEIGIPHIVFTGGEPTTRNDLPELIQYAQDLGQITGLNTNGRKLADKNYLLTLVEAGLDHVQITLESHDETIHDHMVGRQKAWSQTVRGIENALDSPLFVMTNTTLLKENSIHLEETLDFLGELGVPTVGLNALIYSGRGASVGTGLEESELTPLLEIAKSKTHTYNQRLIWYTPTQYCSFDPMQLDLGIKGCTAALYNMCIEANGDVLPCQSYYQPLGNILKDKWENIWEHDLAVALRERKFASAECHSCALFVECGGGCPLYMQHTSHNQQEEV